MRAKKIDSEIEVVVWDTGVGIAAENMGKYLKDFSVLIPHIPG